MLMQKLLSGGEESKLYSDEVFSAYLRTGTGADVTVTTGIDMTKGYMLWSKGRSGATDHAIYDSARGVTLDLASNTTAAQATQANGLKAVSVTGHTVGSLAKMNTGAANYVDFVFRKAPKFFDVVTFTVPSQATKVINHSLGCVPGLIIVKDTTISANWLVYHRSLTSSQYLKLNLTDAVATSVNLWGASGPDASTFTVGADGLTGGSTYVAYLFAHDDSADGIIQCGSYVGTGAAGNKVTLGLEPQFLLIKQAGASTGNWLIVDTMRGLAMYQSEYLHANTANAAGNSSVANLNADGFTLTNTTSDSNAPSRTYIYLAIRRPNKPPTTGAEVFQPVVYTGTNADNLLVNTSITPDMVMVRERNNAAPLGMAVAARLTGNSRLQASSTAVEITDADSFMTPTAGYGNSFSAMNGFGVGNDVTARVNVDNTANNHIALAFKRAPGFFDVVCYTGTGSARTVNHNLGVAPELVVVKKRNLATASDWAVYSSGIGATNYVFLNTAEASASGTYWNSVSPTFSDFSVGTSVVVNDAAYLYVAYLFATLPGISKVGTYVGNNGTQTIPCGFTTGARFVLIKRTDSTGDWFVWDTARNIIEGNDPHLSLNSTAAEVTTNDSIDPDTSGFKVNQVAATNINVNLATYIFLAIS